jgi:hypothetical protein
LARANDVLTSAKRAEVAEHLKYDATCAATGSHLSPFALETTGGHGASTATVYSLLAKQPRDSGLSADVLVGKLNKDISFALRRGTIAQVTTLALDGCVRPALLSISCPLSTRRTGIAGQPPSASSMTML